MEKDSVKVGLLGIGTIGGGVASIIKQNGDLIRKRLGFDLELAKVADLDPSRLDSLGLEVGKTTTRAEDILDDPGINIVIELIGGLEPARTFIVRALEQGKHVVTANKDLLATHGSELFDLAFRKNLNIFYEASVGGGIPLIRPLKYSLIADKIQRLAGIVNGTTNYILTRMDKEELTLEDALASAQEKGFAESDPTNDIEGLDAAYKLLVLSRLAFGAKPSLDNIYVQGIRGVAREDIRYARELGYVVKLLAVGDLLPEGLALRVHPALVPAEHPLAAVQNEINAVFVQGKAVGDLMFYGPGAGSLPTATAVLADVAEAARCVRGRSACSIIERDLEAFRFVPLADLDNRFYLRFLAADRPGVFAALANVFGHEQVSLDMVIQKRRVGDLAEIVLVTHRAREGAFQRAINQVMEIEAIKPGPSMIRLFC